MPLFIGLLILSLVILFNATKDRWRWKRIATWAGATAGVLLLVFVGLVWYWTQPRTLPDDKHTLWDLRLGTTKEEVLFLKGKPTTEDGSTWSYRKDASLMQSLYFHGDTLTCIFLSGASFELPTVRGIEPYLSYTDASRKLGTPSRTSTNAEGTCRILSYDRLGALFEFGENKILGVGIYLPEYGGIGYIEEHPNDN